MTTGTKKIMILAALGVSCYLLYNEYTKNQALKAAQKKAVPPPGESIVQGEQDPNDVYNHPAVIPHNSIVVGDHTGTSIQTGGFKPPKQVPVNSIAIDEPNPSGVDTFYGSFSGYTKFGQKLTPSDIGFN